MDDRSATMAVSDVFTLQSISIANFIMFENHSRFFNKYEYMFSWIGAHYWENFDQYDASHRKCPTKIFLLGQQKPWWMLSPREGWFVLDITEPEEILLVSCLFGKKQLSCHIYFLLCVWVFLYGSPKIYMFNFICYNCIRFIFFNFRKTPF